MPCTQNSTYERTFIREADSESCGTYRLFNAALEWNSHVVADDMVAPIINSGTVLFEPVISNNSIKMIQILRGKQKVTFANFFVPIIQSQITCSCDFNRVSSYSLDFEICGLDVSFHIQAFFKNNGYLRASIYKKEERVTEIGIQKHNRKSRKFRRMLSAFERRCTYSSYFRKFFEFERDLCWLLLLL